MLALLGVLTISLLLFLILTKKTSAVVALILVPVLTGIIAGKTSELPQMISEGISSIAPTGVMFVFAILFFGVLMDAGTFKPIISKLLRLAGNDPLKIVMVTAILAMLVHLDGSGAVTFLVVIPAMLPVYDQLGMSRLTLASTTALAAGTMNILPWGGPTIRAASALEVSVTELFNPVFIPFLAGLLTVLGIAYFLGKKERINVPLSDSIRIDGSHADDIRLPKWKFLVNIWLILLAVTSIVLGWAPPYAVFMIAFGIALVFNFPKVSDQKERVDAHAKEALLMATILFAAGCFTGILKGSGMMEAMADGIQVILPEFLGKQLPLLTGIISMPASLIFDPDSFYFGILPLLASTAESFQVSGLEVGQAAIFGQMTTGFPVSPLTGSTYLLVGLAGVDLGDHQKKTIPLAFLVTLVMLLVAILIGVIQV